MLAQRVPFAGNPTVLLHFANQYYMRVVEAPLANCLPSFDKSKLWIASLVVSDSLCCSDWPLPDVGYISPIHSYSWVSDLEIAPNKQTGLFFYYGGVYAQKNATLDSTGTCCVVSAVRARTAILTGTFRLSSLAWSYPGPQSDENAVNVFWSVYHPLTENDGLVCRYHGRNTSSCR